MQTQSDQTACVHCAILPQKKRFSTKRGCPTGSESSGCQAEPLDVVDRSDLERHFKRIILRDFAFAKRTRGRFNGQQFEHQKSMFCGEVLRVYWELECKPKVTKRHVCLLGSQKNPGELMEGAHEDPGILPRNQETPMEVASCIWL